MSLQCTHHYTHSIINNQYRQYSTSCSTPLKKGKTVLGTALVFMPWYNHSSHIGWRKTWRVSALTWFHKAWLLFLLISSWLDASFTNHSNCAFLSGKAFITSRAKANRAVSSIWGCLHWRHWLATRTACVIWKTKITKCLIRRRPVMAKRSQAGSQAHPLPRIHTVSAYEAPG